MKQFISKVKNLSQKAAEIKAAMEQLPPKVAEVREAVAATTGQLQQLKSEMQFSVTHLKADNETRLSEAIQEIQASEEVFAKAGFALGGVDLELSPVQRMLVHLRKVEDVHSSMLRSLASANQPRRTTHAILSSLLQANQMAETVELGELEYDEVLVGIGPVPSIRVCWRTPAPAATPPREVAVTAVSAPVAVPATSSPPTAPAFAPGSFFEKRATPALPAAVDGVVTAQPTTPAVAISGKESSPAPMVESADSTDPLARFKKMPSLTVHRK